MQFAEQGEHEEEGERGEKSVNEMPKLNAKIHMFLLFLFPLPMSCGCQRRQKTMRVSLQLSPAI